MNHPAVIILNALLNGQEIKTNNMTYVMSNDDQFGVKVIDESGEECVMITDYSINWLLKFANSLTPDEITLIAANTAFNKVKFNESR